MADTVLAPRAAAIPQTENLATHRAADERTACRG